MENRELRDMKELATCGICLELFTDARSLNCQHSFCLMCLIEYQKSSSSRPCPTCRKDTVPGRESLGGLEPNTPVNDLVALMYRQGYVKDEEPISKGDARATAIPPGISSSTSSREQQTRQQAAQQNTSPPQLTRSRSPLGLDLMSLVGVVGAVGAVGVLPYLAISLIKSRQPVHRGVQCDNCNEENIKGVRYKCGICNDYDLCEKCEKMPRHHIHNKCHLFIKLRRPQKRHIPKTNVLMQWGLELGDFMEEDNIIHSLTRCDHCSREPIIGRRFKCGMCDDYNLCESCEEKAERIHDRDHVFVGIPFSIDTLLIGKLLRFKFY